MERPHAIKTFYVMAHNYKQCYKCPYCIISSRDDLIEKTLEHPFEYDNNSPPPISTLPVSINNYFGDPFIQKKDTFKKLKILEEGNHKGIVGIITKSRITDGMIYKLKDFDLNIQVLYSISGTLDNFDGIPYQEKRKSLEKMIDSGINASLYYRPIIAGINDSEEAIKTVLTDYKNMSGTAFNYAGLMGTKVVLNLLKQNGYNPKLPDGHAKWLEDKKLMSKEKENFLRATARELGLLPFKKTSCLLSYNSGMDHDFNNHFYKPHKYKCDECVMYKDCKSFKDSLTPEDIINKLNKADIKFKDVRKVEKGICPSIKQCSLPTRECYNMKCLTVDMNKITRGDESVLKWITGATINSDSMDLECEVTIIDHLL